MEKEAITQDFDVNTKTLLSSTLVFTTSCDIALRSSHGNLDVAIRNADFGYMQPSALQ
jgi:hypothetical protein